MNAHPAMSTLRRQIRHMPNLAILVGLIAAGTLVAVWMIQSAGYLPCDLCLAERNPYYVAVPLALATAWLARSTASMWSTLGFALLAVLFLASAAFAVYHVGVEWKLWAGPTECTGLIPRPEKFDDFLKQLETVKIVRCDAPALVVLGLSLAEWNVVMSLLLSVVSGAGAVVARGAALRHRAAFP